MSPYNDERDYFAPKLYTEGISYQNDVVFTEMRELSASSSVSMVIVLVFVTMHRQWYIVNWHAICSTILYVIHACILLCMFMIHVCTCLITYNKKISTRKRKYAAHWMFMLFIRTILCLSEQYNAHERNSIVQTPLRTCIRCYFNTWLDGCQCDEIQLNYAVKTVLCRVQEKYVECLSLGTNSRLAFCANWLFVESSE